YHFDIFTRRGFVDILAAEQTPTSQNWFQGTADAVRRSFMHLENNEYEYALILSGDKLYQMDYRDMMATHIKSGAQLTIANIPVTAADATGFGIMQTGEEGEIRRFIEKPSADVLGD